MTYFYLLFVVLGVAFFLFVKNISLIARVFTAFLIVLFFAGAMTVWLLRIGDKPPSESRTIYSAPIDKLVDKREK